MTQQSEERETEVIAGLKAWAEEGKDFIGILAVTAVMFWMLVEVLEVLR